MFDPFETEFIHSPTILVCPNDPIGRIGVIAISILQMILTYYNDKWRYRLTIKIDTLNYNDPFPIAKLYNFNFPMPVIQCYNKSGCNLAHKKACFIEVSDVGFYNTMFGNYILEKLKPNPNDLWIFVLGPLVIVQTIPMYTELWLSFDEVGSSTRSNTYCIIYRQ